MARRLRRLRRLRLLTTGHHSCRKSGLPNCRAPNHEILLLDAQLPIRGDEELLFVSVAELAQWKDARAEVNSRFEVHRAACYAESLARFEAETGKSWDSGTRKPGRAKKTAAVRQEAREVNQHTSGRKSA